jgi:hypothetical protein
MLRLALMQPQAYFETRLQHDVRREILWQTLCRYYFSRLISEDDCVLELGAGYGDFINNAPGKRKIAVDSWPGFSDYLEPDVEGRVGPVTSLSFLEPSSVNFAFASNLFEHVSQEDFSSVLRQLRKALAKGGTLNILQPNYYYAYRQYFDDYTHRTVYTHVSIVDFLESHGYEVIECRRRFLPLTVKSRLPVSPMLIRLYLSSPWKPFGRQMLIRSRVRS